MIDEYTISALNKFRTRASQLPTNLSAHQKREQLATRRLRPRAVERAVREQVEILREDDALRVEALVVHGCSPTGAWHEDPMRVTSEIACGRCRYM